MAGGNDAYCSFCSRMDERWTKNTLDIFHFVNQCQSMLNSLSMLRQYLWYHLLQCHCLHRRKHSHSACKWHGWTINNSIPLKSSVVSVVFTFNMSVKCFTASLSIELSNRTAKGGKCLRKKETRQKKTKHARIKRPPHPREKEQSMSCSLSMRRRSAQPHLLQCYYLFTFRKKTNLNKETGNENKKPFTHKKNQCQLIYCSFLMLQRCKKHQNHQLH